MDHQTRTLRFGAAVIACSVLARLGATGAFHPAAEFLRRPETQSFIVYLETGRKVRFSPSLEEKSNFVGESAPPLTLFEDSISLPCFASSDAKRVDLTNMSGLKPDLEDLLSRSLAWNLKSEKPTVLILHTHATESYTKSGEAYA